MTEAKQLEVQRQVKELLKLGVIEPSKSSWAALVVLVPKGNDQWRMCIDYRRLNQVTENDAYPLPRIDDLLTAIGHAKVFSSIDLKNGFHQIRMRHEDKFKTAFITPSGLFQFNVMPFG